jgi:hypothetical protein
VLLFWSLNQFDEVLKQVDLTGSAEGVITLTFPNASTFMLPFEAFYIVLLFCLAGVIFLPLHIYEAVRNLRVKYRFKEWMSDFLDQQYILYFETGKAIGDTEGERILSMAQKVFPELRLDLSSFSPSFSDYVKSILRIKKERPSSEIIKESLNYRVNSYILDLNLETRSGYFIVKDFKDKVVTFDDLRYLVNAISQIGIFKYRIIRVLLANKRIFRVICVADNYDPNFFNPDWLETSMTQKLITSTEFYFKNLPRFPIDLLIRHKAGYSVLWIGPIE